MKERQRGEESQPSCARLSTHTHYNKLPRLLWTRSGQGSLAGQPVDWVSTTWKIKHTCTHTHTDRHLWTAVNWQLRRSDVKQRGRRRRAKSFIGVKTRLSSQVGMCPGTSAPDTPGILCVFIIHKHPPAPILFTVTALVTRHRGIPGL